MSIFWESTSDLVHLLITIDIVSPDALAADLCEMFGKNGGAYGVVPGKDGY